MLEGFTCQCQSDLLFMLLISQPFLHGYSTVLCWNCSIVMEPFLQFCYFSLNFQLNMCIPYNKQFAANFATGRLTDVLEVLEYCTAVLNVAELVWRCYWNCLLRTRWPCWSHSAHRSSTKTRFHWPVETLRPSLMVWPRRMSIRYASVEYLIITLLHYIEIFNVA